MPRKALNPEEELFLRVKTIMVLRVVFLTGFVALIIPFQSSFEFSPPIVPLSFVIGSAYFLTLIYAIFLKFWNPQVGISIQFAGDLLIVGGIVYTTGGIHSPFSFLFLFVIIATSVVLPKAGCYLVASGASIIYGLLVDLEFYRVIHPVYLDPESNVSLERGYVFYVIFLNIASYYAVAYLSSLLSNRLRIMREELAMASLDLRELQAFHSSVVEDMGNGLLTTNLEGQITSINQAGESITGYGPDDCLGIFAGDVLNIKQFKIFLQNPSTAVLPLEVEGECQRRDEKKLFIRMKISRFSGHGIPIKGYICVFEDLSEVREMQEKYYQAQQLAVVGRFSAGLAHEIRNPLASMSGSIQVLSKGLKLENSYRKLMDIVIKETDRLNVILSEFLNYSQPKIPQSALVDFTQVIQDHLILIKNSDEYRPDVVIDFKPSFDHIIVDGDEEHIKQLVWNLCINALHAMPEGGRLHIKLQSVDGYKTAGYSSINKGVVFSVQDEGCGIPKDQIKKVFDPFYTTKENGVGLGLANVYQIVQQNGGTIDIESEENGGTRFIVYLPQGDQKIAKTKHDGEPNSYKQLQE